MDPRYMDTLENNTLSIAHLIHAQLVYALLISVQSTGVLWFQSSDGSNEQNL